MLIVQHMPPLFTQLLAERLDSKSGLRVTEGAQGDLLARGQVTIAPGGHHMVIERHNTAVRIAINDGPPENSCRPAVDPLFRSVVATYGPHCLAVVLTGMGQDGLRGCEAVAAAGGQVLVQDEATSVVWGMPGFVSRAGLADAVVPLDRVAGEIVRRVGKRRTVAETTTAQTTGAGT
jgi:two-component system chemotaxis response regulator CheB